MKRILSGITPSGDGNLHIGNYLGAVKQFIELSKTHECFLMFADLHALTTVQNSKELAHNIQNLILNEIALVGELPNVYFFRQSDVPLHTELQSILNNVTPLGLLKRAHAYKDKLANPSTTLRTGDDLDEEINVGLFSYPILMAADILIYKADVVPVGKDQKQHIEITRDIAQRFNKIFKGSPSTSLRKEKEGVFKLPEPYIPEDVAVVLGTDGKRKMSKSLGNIISIFESEDVIRKQVNSTFTDPTRKHASDPGHIEGNMVFAYLDHFGDMEHVTRLKEAYTQGKIGDVEVKDYLYQSLLKYFAPARKRYEELKNDSKKVKDILEKGTDKVRSVATQTMDEVRQAIGLTNQYSFFEYTFRHPDQVKRVEGSSTPKSVEKDSSISPPAGGFARNDNGYISIDDFARVEQRVGKVIEAKNVEGSEKLIRLTVDFGDPPAGGGTRIIFTGVRPFGYTPEDFQNKQFFFVVNLAPRKMLNEFSQGMILAVDDKAQGKPIFVSAEGMPVGAVIR